MGGNRMSGQTIGEVCLRQVSYLEWPMVEQGTSGVVCLEVVMSIGEVVGGRLLGY